MTASLSLSTDLVQLTLDETGLVTAWIDDPSAPVNKISEDMLDAFSDVLRAVERSEECTGLIFISGKDDSFVAGADLDMLSDLHTPAEARAISRRAHRLVWRVQNLDVPTVAAIQGPCMGGGLEMTLGCDTRVASTHDATRLALPEVQLGLLPGGGGTQYLPRLVGVQQALTLILTGKNVYPEKARRIGLVDALIHPPGLHAAAKRAARDLMNGESMDRHGPSVGEKLLESTPVSRRIIYRQARKRTESRTRGNYPAPPRIIDAVKTGTEEGLDHGLDVETQHFGDLVFTPESKALVQVFFAKRRGEKNPLSDQAHPVQNVGVLGAGLMGSGIAEVTVENDMNVVLRDQTLDLAAGGKEHVWRALNRKKEKGIVNRFERDQIAERVTPTATYDDLKECDLVIEAVPEDLDLKHQVVSETEAVISNDAVLASNTSSLPITEIAEAAERPERVVGMHYFSPVADIPLIEIIATEDTSEDTIATAVETGLAQGKTAIVVNDGPGFYTTRILALYMNEALLLLEEGAEVETVDTMMTNFGFPMGPYELFDFVGLDVAGKITDVMRARLSDDRLEINDAASRLAAANLLGQKSDRGFYTYDPDEASTDREPQEVNDAVYGFAGPSTRSTPPRETVQNRLALMMVNEAVRCLDDEVLRTPTDGDLGAVFGLGFPPFLGGPFRYVDQEGVATVVERLDRLADRYGSRFDPAPLLRDHVDNGTSFYEE